MADIFLPDKIEWEQIRSGDTTSDFPSSYITSTPATGAKRGLDVNVVGGSITIGTVDVGSIAGPVALPTGASTESTLLSVESTLSAFALDFASVDFATQTTLSALNAKIPSGLTVTSTRLLVDGSGVIQPVSGTVTANQGGTWNLNNISGTISLPTGASTETTLSALSAKFNSLGQKTMANSAPIVIASDQSAVPISGSVTVSGTVAATQSGTWNIANVSGTVSLPTGASTLAEQQTQTTSLQLIDDLVLTQNTSITGLKGLLVMANANSSAPTYGAGTANPISMDRAGCLRTFLTNGTQSTPMMDAVNRRGFQTITDGTNTMPTMDVVGRAGFQKITDGTNTMPTMDAAARAGFQKITDGTNTMPTMDVGTRSGFVKIYDASGIGNIGASVLSISGAGIIPTVATDAFLNFQKFFTDGSTYSYTASTDGTQANVKFLLCDSSRRLVIVSANNTALTYGFTIQGLAPAASATDILEIIGSGTKTIKITQILLSGTSSSAVNTSVQLIKRSTAATGGTSSAPTIGPYDSTNAAATATAKAYTANPTTGTPVFTVRSRKYFFSSGTTYNDPYSQDFGVNRAQPIVLRGTSQTLCINLNGVTVSGGSIDISVEFTEE